jgi:hypothetical protein
MGYQVRLGAVPAPHRSPGRASRHHSGTGRHRAGTPELRYCGDLPGVRLRLAGRQRGFRPVSPAALTLLLTVLLGATLVSGWLTANGATAFAGMIAR